MSTFLYVPAIGLTLALDGVSIDGGGISAKSFLSSLMAVSTRALSGLDSVTYRRLATEDLEAVAATARGSWRRGAATPAAGAPRRLDDLRAEDTRLAMMIFGDVIDGRWWRVGDSIVEKV